MTWHRRLRGSHVVADAIGGLLLLVLLSFATVATLRTDHLDASLLGALLLAVVSYLAGRALPAQVTSAVLVAVAIGTVVAVTMAGWFNHSPLAPPLGYANANAALVAQAAAGAGYVGLRSPRDDLALAGWLLAPVLASWLLLNTLSGGGATAAVVGLLLTLVTAVLIATRPVWAMVRGWVAALIGGLLAAIAVSIALPGGTGCQAGALVNALSDRRCQLWRDALSLAGSEPLTGHGIGTFPILSPTAASDADTRAAHSVFLELAAEAGWPMAALVLAVIVWIMVRLTLTRRLDTLLVVAAVDTFALQATIDYIADFPVIIATTAFLAGAATLDRIGISPRTRAPENLDSRHLRQ